MKPWLKWLEILSGVITMAVKLRPFRLLITGSREWEDIERIWWALSKIHEKIGPREGVLIHGTARGVDQMAAGHWLSIMNSAKRLGPRRIEGYPANWDTFGNRAGHKRNAHMVSLGANLCLAFIRNKSVGATDCARRAEKAGIRTIRLRDDS